MRDWVGLGPAEAQHLHDLGLAIEPELPQIVERFYEKLLANRDASKVLADEQQIDRLRQTLLRWLKALFGGEYGEAYFSGLESIGRTHVKVGLPHRFMFTGIDLLRTELVRRIQKLNRPPATETIEALHKLLDLNLMVMLDTYFEDYMVQVRQADQRAMQRRLDEIKHMASLGQLAASLAHEIKNPLAGISGAIQILSKDLKPSDPHRKIMNEILKQIDRLDRAVKDLLIYARPKAPEVTECDVGRSVRSCLTLLKQDPALRQLQIDFDGMDQGIRALLDRTQFEQVIANLMLNAAQACDDNGRVRIGLSENNGKVSLIIKDNGCGMSDEVLHQAAEPFFTTKARGTGLGLPICKRIIESHQGKVVLESTPGEGTEITIILPSLASA